MRILSHKYTESELSKFASEEWDKTLCFLKNKFGITEDDCKDIFQEAFIVLFTNVKSGKLDNMTASLSTYFLSICKNMALRHLRNSSDTVNIDDELKLSLMDGEIREEKIEALLDLDEDAEFIAQKEELVQAIVRELPSPCNELLWGFYRDNLSMKTIAEMFNYSSEGAAKVTKHRCCEKFRAKYKELRNKLF